MHSSFYDIFKSKRQQAFLAIISALFLISTPPALEAGGWGKTGEVVKCEGVSFSGYNFDMNGLNFHAYIPVDSHTVLDNGSVAVASSPDAKFAYSISTSLIPLSKPPKTLKEFIKAIKISFPNGDLTADQTQAKKLGSKYVLDMVEKNQQPVRFWRCLATKDRFIFMRTDDSNPARRAYFFDNILIK